MKKLLLLILLLPVITQAQKVTDLLDGMAENQRIMTENQSMMFKIISQNTEDIARIDKIININAHYDVDKFRELEKRIAELEKKLDNHLQDSIIKMSPVSKYEMNKTSDLVHKPYSKYDTIWIDSEMDIYDLPVIRLRKWRK